MAENLDLEFKYSGGCEDGGTYNFEDLTFSVLIKCNYYSKSGSELLALWSNIFRYELYMWGIEADYHNDLPFIERWVAVEAPSPDFRKDVEIVYQSLDITMEVARYLKRKFGGDFSILIDLHRAIFQTKSYWESRYLFEKIELLILDADAPQPSVSQSQFKIIGKTKESQQINGQIIVGSRMGLSDQQIKDRIDKKFPDADINLNRIRSRRLVLKKNNLM